MSADFWAGAANCVQGKAPAHAQIEQWLMRAIRTGDLLESEKLPPERSLAQNLGVSRMTLRQALASLEAKGAVRRKTGHDGGTFICDPTVMIDLSELAGLKQRLIRSGHSSETDLIEAVTVAVAPEAGADARSDVDSGSGSPSADHRGPGLAAAMGVHSGASVHRIIRVRRADGEAIGVERSYFPAVRLAGLLDQPLDGSIYEVLSGQGAAPVEAVEYLSAGIVSAEDASLLEIPEGTAVMRIKRIAKDSSGRVVEFSKDVFRSDRMTWSVRSAVNDGR